MLIHQDTPACERCGYPLKSGMKKCPNCHTPICTTCGEEN